MRVLATVFFTKFPAKPLKLRYQDRTHPFRQSSTELRTLPGNALVTTTARSFRLDVGRFDERPPFLDLRFLERAEGLRALLIRCGNLLAQFGQSCLDA
jgi:hypothetical protein